MSLHNRGQNIRQCMVTNQLEATLRLTYILSFIDWISDALSHTSFMEGSSTDSEQH